MKKEPTVDINPLRGETTSPMFLQTRHVPIAISENSFQRCPRSFSKSDQAVLEEPRGQPRGKYARGKSKFDHSLLHFVFHPKFINTDGKMPLLWSMFYRYRSVFP